MPSPKRSVAAAVPPPESATVWSDTEGLVRASVESSPEGMRFVLDLRRSPASTLDEQRATETVEGVAMLFWARFYAGASASKPSPALSA